MSDQTPAELAVARGMALLDAKVPGWEDRIDLDRLDLRDPEACICGQLFGQFSQAFRPLEIDSASYVGFYEGPRAGWAAMERVWRRAILARRAARAESPDA